MLRMPALELPTSRTVSAPSERMRSAKLAHVLSSAGMSPTAASLARSDTGSTSNLPSESMTDLRTS